MFLIQCKLNYAVFSLRALRYVTHDAYDALMAYYESAASEYDEVNEIRQYYFQSAASLILRRSFRDRDEFAPTLITTYVVQFLAFSSILACAQCI